MHKISVIVPVYNVENHLEKCVRSIQAQTYDNLEIILVDDGSPDQCGLMCDAFAAEDNRIRVIHKENGGLSSARNAGIDASTGEYLAFVDSDDWIDPPMYAMLYKLCLDHQAQLAECSFRSIYPDYIKEETPCSGRIFTCSPAEAIQYNLQWKYLKPVAWNKLYHRSVIGSIRYPVGRIHEDEFTTHKYYLAAETIVFADVSMYNYIRQRENSIMGSFRIQNLDGYDAFRERLLLIWSRDDLRQLHQMMANAYCDCLFQRLKMCNLHGIRGKRVDEIITSALALYDDLRAHGISEANLQKFDILMKYGLGSL